jgi:hypothetical protein
MYERVADETHDLDDLARARRCSRIIVRASIESPWHPDRGVDL